MKNFLFLSSIILVFAVACNPEETEPDTNNGGGVDNPSLSSISTSQYELVTSLTTLADQASGTSGSSTFNNSEIGETLSEYNFGWGLQNFNNDVLFLASKGPYTSTQLPPQSAFHGFFTEGDVQEFGDAAGQWTFYYLDENGEEFNSEDFDQTGSTLTIVDSQAEGDYMRVYATFSCKLFSSTETTTGYFVGVFYRS